MGLGQGEKGRGLAAPGVGLEDAHAPVPAGQVAHRGPLVGAQVRVGGEGGVDLGRRERQPHAGLLGQREKALLGAQQIGRA